MPRRTPWAGSLVGFVLGLSLWVGWLASPAATLDSVAHRLMQRPSDHMGSRRGDVALAGGHGQRLLGTGHQAAWVHRPTRTTVSGDSQGVKFWLAFPGNLLRSDLSLAITGNADTQGRVAIPGLRFSLPFTITAGMVTTVTLPPTAAVDSSDRIENKGVQVTAENAVTVYGLNRLPTTTEAYLGLPIEGLGTEYIVLGYRNATIPGVSQFAGTQFVVLATADATIVTITPSVTTGERGAGLPYSIVLQRGQTYQLRNTDPAPTDLSGTIITANKAIAVFGGHQCANVPPGLTFCDHLVEQLPPVVTWGKNFVTMPLATRVDGDTFRFLAATDSTTVSVNGTPVTTLDRGQVFEQVIATPAQISADQPILVAQYSRGGPSESVLSDQFMMVIPPFEQFLGRYTVTTPARRFPSNFINVVAPDAAIGAITVNGADIPAASFRAIGASGFSGVQLPINPGAHHLAGPLPFGVFVSGFAEVNAYGYPGGMSLAPVVNVKRLELTPQTATTPLDSEHCVTATAGDQQRNPVGGVRVDFDVSGANRTVGYAVTAENGRARFCYIGTHLGTDTIVASVGDIADIATDTWIELVLEFSDGRNALTVNGTSGEFILTYVVDDIPQLCSGSGARVSEGLLTLATHCREDLRDTVRASGPVEASMMVQLIDYLGATGNDRIIREFLLTRQPDDGR